MNKQINDYLINKWTHKQKIEWMSGKINDEMNAQNITLMSG